MNGLVGGGLKERKVDLRGRGGWRKGVEGRGRVDRVEDGVGVEVGEVEMFVWLVESREVWVVVGDV